MPADLAELQAKQQKLAELLRSVKKITRGAASAGGYSGHRERMLTRERAASRSAREIGEIPLPKNPKQLARARRDLRFFAKSYFPEIFFLPFSEDHKKVIRIMQQVIRGGGRFAIAMPRGSGKTSLSLIAALWAILFGYIEYVLLIAANAGKARDLLQVLKDTLSDNSALAADFPGVCFPIEKLEGISQRRLLHRGRRIKMEFTKTRIILPDIEGEPSAAAIVGFVGLTASLRGAIFKRPDGRIVRPGMVIIDDPQTDESARRPGQVERRTEIVKKAVLGLGGAGVEIAILMPCTVIEPDDLAARFLDRSRNPEFQGIVTKCLYKFPADLALWRKYDEVRREELTAGGDGSAAAAFYRAHRKAMDLGAKVAWPQMKKPRHVSGIQYAMDLYLQDERAFLAEQQNDPKPPEQIDQARALQTADVFNKLNGRPRLEVPQRAAKLTAFIDVHDELLYYQIVAWESDFTGSIIAYGTWPEQTERYFTLHNALKTLPNKYPGLAKEAVIYAGLDEALKYLMTARLPRDDGSEQSLDLCLIDTGYVPDIVAKAIRSGSFGARVLPSRGLGLSARNKPFSEYKPEPGVQRGRHWRIAVAPSTRLRTVVIDVNYWKSFLRDCWLAPPGTASALTLFGTKDKPEPHGLYADHAASEFPVKTFGNGRWLEEWRKIPDRENHFWDCAVGSTVAASVLGIASPLWTLAVKQEPQSMAALRSAARGQGTGDRGQGTGDPSSSAKPLSMREMRAAARKKS